MKPTINNKNPVEELAHEGSQFKKILKHSPWYLASSLLTKAISFFLLPIYTRYLSPEDYGILANLESFGRIVPIILSLHMDAAFLRFYYKERTVSKENIRRLYSTHFWFVVGWGGVLAYSLILMAPIFFERLISIPFWPVAVVVTTQLLGQLSVMVTSMWRANLEARKVSLLKIWLSLFGVVLALVMLIPLEMSWVSRIYASGFVGLAQIAILLSIALKAGWISFQFDTSMLRRSIIYAVPLVPNVLAGWIAGFSDRMILSYYGRLDEAGLYSVAYQIAFVLYVFNDAMTQVQGPISMSAMTSDRERARIQIVEFLLVFLWVISLIYLVLALFSRELLAWFVHERFHEAYKLVAILGLLYILSGAYRIFTVIVSFFNKTWIISTGAILQALISIALNFSLIPVFGMYAAAWSSVISLSIYTAWIVIWSQKIFRISIPIRPLAILFVIVTVIMLGGKIVDSELEITPLSILYKILLFCGFFVSLIVVDFSRIRNALFTLYKRLIVKKSYVS